MPFRINDRVTIRSLKRAGKVNAVLKGATYRVQLGNMTITCKRDDLELLEKEPDSPKAKKSKSTKSPRLSLRSVKGKQSSVLDLHGLKVDEALSKVSEAINRAIMDGYSHLDFIHGHGKGKIRQALHEYLAGLKVVASFALVPENTGITRVYF